MSNLDKVDSQAGGGPIILSAVARRKASARLPKAPSQIKQILTNPTSGYNGGSAWWGWPTSILDNKPVFTWMDVPRMTGDPQVKFLERMWRAPFHRKKWEVKSENPKVQQYVDVTLRKFWKSSLPKILSRYFRYGYGVGGAEFSVSRGWVKLDCVRCIEPRDATPLVYTEGDQIGKPAGYSLAASPAGSVYNDAFYTGGTWVQPPHAFWFAGYGEFSNWYDQPPISGLFRPWLEKNGRGGALQSRQAWFRKCAGRGGIIYHPDGTSQFSGDTSSERQNQDIAREALDYQEFAGSMTFVNDTNPNDPSKYAWDYKEPISHADVAGIREYPQDLDREMMIGVGIPPEVLEASDVGSGWSGRLIPMLSLLGGVDELSGMIIDKATDKESFIRHGVNANFGDVWYEVEPLSLAEEIQTAAQSQSPDETIPGYMDEGQARAQAAGTTSVGGAGGQGVVGSGRGRAMSFGVDLSAVHAPEGGVTIGGRAYRGGEFIPGDVLARANDSERAALGADSQQQQPSVSPADAVDSRARSIVRMLKGLPKRAVKFARRKAGEAYQWTEKRYGPAYAKTITRIALSGLPVPVPGALAVSLVASAIPLAVAELHLRLKRIGPTEPVNPDIEGVVRPGALSFISRLYRGTKKALRLSNLDKVVASAIECSFDLSAARPEDFESAIRAEPLNQTNRHAYADHLEENGEHDLAAYHRSMAQWMDSHSFRKGAIDTSASIGERNGFPFLCIHKGGGLRQTPLDTGYTTLSPSHAGDRTFPEGVELEHLPREGMILGREIRSLEDLPRWGSMGWYSFRHMDNAFEEAFLKRLALERAAKEHAAAEKQAIARKRAGKPGLPMSNLDKRKRSHELSDADTVHRMILARTDVDRPHHEKPHPGLILDAMSEMDHPLAYDTVENMRSSVAERPHLETPTAANFLLTPELMHAVSKIHRSYRQDTPEEKQAWRDPLLGDMNNDVNRPHATGDVQWSGNAEVPVLRGHETLHGDPGDEDEHEFRFSVAPHRLYQNSALLLTQHAYLPGDPGNTGSGQVIRTAMHPRHLAVIAKHFPPQSRERLVNYIRLHYPKYHHLTQEAPPPPEGQSNLSNLDTNYLTPDIDSFLQQIRENPHEATPTLAFADWLEEHDLHAMARVVREHATASNRTFPAGWYTHARMADPYYEPHDPADPDASDYDNNWNVAIHEGPTIHHNANRAYLHFRLTSSPSSVIRFASANVNEPHNSDLVHELHDDAQKIKPENGRVVLDANADRIMRARLATLPDEEEALNHPSEMSRTVRKPILPQNVVKTKEYSAPWRVKMRDKSFQKKGTTKGEYNTAFTKIFHNTYTPPSFADREELRKLGMSPEAIEAIATVRRERSASQAMDRIYDEIKSNQDAGADWNTVLNPLHEAHSKAYGDWRAANALADTHSKAIPDYYSTVYAHRNATPTPEDVDAYVNSIKGQAKPEPQPIDATPQPAWKGEFDKNGIPLLTKRNKRARMPVMDTQQDSLLSNMDSDVHDIHELAGRPTWFGNSHTGVGWFALDRFLHRGTRPIQDKRLGSNKQVMRDPTGNGNIHVRLHNTDVVTVLHPNSVRDADDGNLENGRSNGGTHYIVRGGGYSTTPTTKRTISYITGQHMNTKKGDVFIGGVPFQDDMVIAPGHGPIPYESGEESGKYTPEHHALVRAISDSINPNISLPMANHDLVSILGDSLGDAGHRRIAEILARVGEHHPASELRYVGNGIPARVKADGDADFFTRTLHTPRGYVHTAHFRLNPDRPNDEPEYMRVVHSANKVLPLPSAKPHEYTGPTQSYEDAIAPGPTEGDDD